MFISGTFSIRTYETYMRKTTKKLTIQICIWEIKWCRILRFSYKLGEINMMRHCSAWPRNKLSNCSRFATNQSFYKTVIMRVLCADTQFIFTSYLHPLNNLKLLSLYCDWSARTANIWL